MLYGYFKADFSGQISSPSWAPHLEKKGSFIKYPMQDVDLLKSFGQTISKRGIVRGHLKVENDKSKLIKKG